MFEGPLSSSVSASASESASASASASATSFLSSSTSFALLQQCLQDRSSWFTPVNCHGSIGCLGGVGYTKPSSLDICQYMERHAFALHPESSFRFDPEMFKGNTPEMTMAIQTYVIQQCRASGFPIMTANGCKRSPKGTRLCTLRFICCHNRIAPDSAWDTSVSSQQPQTKIQTPKAKTSVKRKKNEQKINPKPRGKNIHSKRRRSILCASSEDCQCPFSFIIFCCQKDQHWYLSHRRTTTTDAYSGQHTGHFQTPPQHLRTRLHEIDEKEITLALQMQSLFLDNTTIAQLLEMRSPDVGSYTNKQIAYLKTKAKSQQIVDNFDPRSSSAAERLLNGFQSLIDSGSSVHFVALTHSTEEGYRIKFPKGRRPVHLDSSAGMSDILL